MSKKVLWKDNNTPPTNYIWAKTDSDGRVIGIYKHDGDKWVPVQTPSTEGVPITNEPSQVYITDEYGNQATIQYSIDEIPNTFALRTNEGNLRTGNPIDNNDCVPLILFSWIDV